MAQLLDIDGESRQRAAPGRAGSFKKLTNFVGAGLSLGLMIGVGVWGYKLLVRDVSGIPVVRAATGPMRELPDDPGGTQMADQGLAVNAVTAVGSAADPADRLILAPPPIELSLEDDAAPVAAPEAVIEAVIEPVPEAVIEPVSSVSVENAAAVEADQADTVEALAERIAAGVTPIDQAPVIAGGLGTSLRPHLRPASLRQAPAVSQDTEIEAADIPVGTFMAQLGAYDSAGIARGEWDRLSGRYDSYLTGKTRVIQKATSGGRVFYRLRAMGFADINDARRFCSALIAEGADCISVVSR
ncbi:FIG00992541: hypothetical protein [hydrothermal vent metagenome]|uniref:SPOR domain-containing protein n=1 Tax=hydrothermal vent metagenome TaxID=652676 RepID=A0A3B0RFF5_9ZZZZ